MTTKNEPTPIRIHKFLAEQGLCSRRHAEEWIREGRVSVNGQPAKIGQSIVPGTDLVKVRGKCVRPESTERLTLVMNKPRGVLCTNADPEGGRTVFDLLPDEYKKRHLYCAGRLDKDSEGLLILTNDGTLPQKLTHPSSGVVKRYQVMVNRPIDPKILERFLSGVVSEGETLVARKIVRAETGPNADRRVEIFLEQGRKREIRRMFETFGYFVKSLKRVQMGAFVLRKLGLGSVRLVTQKEQTLLTKPTLGKDGGAPPPRPRIRPFREKPTARERRYAEQKLSAQRLRDADRRPFSARALREAKEGDNILARFEKRPREGGASRRGKAAPRAQNRRRTRDY